MREDLHATARRQQGTNQAKWRGLDGPSINARRQEAFGTVSPALRLNSVSNLLTFWLFLSSLRPVNINVGAVSGFGKHAGCQASRLGPLALATFPSEPPSGVLPSGSPLPAAMAAGGGVMSGGSVSEHLSAMANGVVLACAVAPRHCMSATMLMIGGTGLVAAGRVLLKQAASPDAVVAARGGDSRQVAAEDALSASVMEMPVEDPSGQSSHMAIELLRIAHLCGGDRQCRAEHINALLLRIPSVSRQQLLAMVAATSAPAGSSAGLPGAQAAVLPSAVDLMEQLVQTLSNLYTPEVAAYQDDLERIAHAASPDDAELDGNGRRMECIEGLLMQQGHAVRRAVYDTAGMPARGRTLPPQAYNLHAEVKAGTGPRLLLVAHGDRIGEGSQGAYDNASGVAALLHVARQLAAQPGPGDGAVELLITSHEELGLLGSRAFVAHCRRQASCPALVINVDMVGRGGHGVIVSGTDAVAAYNNPGQPPYYLRNPTVTQQEMHARPLIEAAFAAQGFTRHLLDRPYMITSDNLSFQNASIPCVGLMQASPLGAEALRDIEDARVRWLDAARAVDLERMERARANELILRDDEVEKIKAWQGAYDDYVEIWRSRGDSPLRGIHNERDRVFRVNPQMAVSFADVLVSIGRDWNQQ